MHFRMTTVPENDQKDVYTVQKGSPFLLGQHQCLQQESPAANIELLFGMYIQSHWINLISTEMNNLNQYAYYVWLWSTWSGPKYL
jgi:hypothetical protein